MNLTENMIRIIDNYITTWDMSDEDYITLNYNISWYLKCIWVRTMDSIYLSNLSLDATDITNELLLFLKTKESKYDMLFHMYQKKKYINLVIKKCLLNVFREYMTMINADTVFWKNRVWVGDEFLSRTQQELFDVNDMDNINEAILVEQILNSVWSLSDRERNIFSMYFLSNIQQEVISKDLWISQQRLSKILSGIKNKIIGSVTI